MKLAEVESWNYFLHIKINPSSTNTFISRCKKESLASSAKKIIKTPFLRQSFFFSTILSQGKVWGEKGNQELKS